MRYRPSLLLAIFSVAFSASALPSPSEADAFAVAGVTRSEASVVLVQLQVAVAAHDAKLIAALTFFPLTVRGKAGPRNAAELERDFDAVFTDKVRSAILGQTVDELFASWRGLMIGRGEAWLVALCDNTGHPGKCAKHRLLLFSINN